jgi:hypothetical protein
MASISTRRCPTITSPRSFKSSAVRLGRTFSLISFSRNAYIPFKTNAAQPIPEVHYGVLMTSFGAGAGPGHIADAITSAVASSSTREAVPLAPPIPKDAKEPSEVDAEARTSAEMTSSSRLPTSTGPIAPIKRGRDCCCVSPQARWCSPRSLIPVPRCHFGTKTGRLRSPLSTVPAEIISRRFRNVHHHRF